jgi:hypothetical protein
MFRIMSGIHVPDRTALRIATMAFLLAGIAAQAQAQFWNKKDYQKWSAGECHKILSDSPWAQNYTFSMVQMPNGATQTAIPGRQPLLEVEYTAIFFSALPVREAQVRLGQIESHYDKMSPAQKKAFDESAARYLAVPFPTDTVVLVNYSTNVNYLVSPLASSWQLQTTATLENSAFLFADGKTVRLRRYQPDMKQPHFFLFFPREANGTPILSGATKSLTVQITSPQLQFSNTFGSGSLTAQAPNARNIIFSFNVKKMMYHGKIAY